MRELLQGTAALEFYETFDNAKDKMPEKMHSSTIWLPQIKN